MIDKTLGHYQISSQLGKGGMGEVYQAKDQVLGRDVAIKVLPEEFARDADRVARFQREAKLLASLNHPNIAAIYGLEESGGTNFLVLELVEGETMADQMKRGLIPAEDSLKLALQIAEALEAAHEKGVIHRDLKPANIKVTPDGKVKVLDFGLAKAFAGEQADLNLSNSPTLSNAATQQGVILGTAAYMSPEQARGKPVDKRADIWAFGCVLYEMLTGQAAFQGEDLTEILASVVKGGANLDLLPANTHPRVREILSRCLQKDIRKRYRDAGDIGHDLEQALSDTSGVSMQSSAITEYRANPRAMPAWIAAIAILSIAATAIAVWYLKPSAEPKPVSRTCITLPPGQILQSLNTALLALSPDGTKLAYVSSQEGIQRIYLRNLDSFEAKPIAGTENGENPFFSPDGQWLGFAAGRKLMIVSTKGGAPRPLTETDISAPRGIAWGENGMIVIAPAWGGKGLVQIPEAGGSPTSLTRLSADSGSHVFPQFIPGGQAVLFTAEADNVENSQIMVHSLKTGRQKVLVKGVKDARYVPTGHLVYTRHGNVYAVPFDAQRLEVEGTETPILEGVMQGDREGGAQFSFSRQGSLAYVDGVLGAKRTLVWVDRSGNETPLGAPPDSYYDLRFSPDGSQVAVTISGAVDDLYVYDIPSGRFNRLTFQRGASCPVWMPDGKRIVFRSVTEKGASRDLFWLPSDGSGAVESIASWEHGVIPTGCSSDGKWIAFMALHPTNGWDLWALPLDKARKAVPVLQTRFNEGIGGLSPDGRWIAYGSDESGKYEIYVRPFPGSGGVRQISKDGGSDPVWARSGELFYRNGDKMMAVDVQTTPAFKPGTTRMLFEKKFDPALYQPYDVTSDGKRFLIIKPGEAGQSATQINIVLNWFEELKQKVPVK